MDLLNLSLLDLGLAAEKVEHREDLLGVDMESVADQS